MSQTELAKEYTVSRIPIRDALLGLAADQLVEVIPGRGARVTDTPRLLDDHEATAAAFIAGQAAEASTLLASDLRASLDRLRTLSRGIHVR